MEFIQINTQHFAGVIKSVTYGKEPYSWALLEVMSVCNVVDRYGTRLAEKVYCRVIVQGTENVKALRPRMKEGHYVYAMGQLAPIRFAAAESAQKGNALLAADIKISQQPVEEWRKIHG